MNYEFECPDGHVFEVRCRMDERDDEHCCTYVEFPAEVGASVSPDDPTHLQIALSGKVCGKVGKRLISSPHVNDPNKCVLTYPGSMGLKAGYVHSHGPKMATKLQSGYGGVVTPTAKHEHPIAAGVQPEAAKNPKPL